MAARPPHLPVPCLIGPACMPKALLIAAIFTVYFGFMAALMGYMARQVRHRDEDERDDTRLDEDGPQEDEPGGLLLAA